MKYAAVLAAAAVVAVSAETPTEQALEHIEADLHSLESAVQAEEGGNASSEEESSDSAAPMTREEKAAEDERILSKLDSTEKGLIKSNVEYSKGVYASSKTKVGSFLEKARSWAASTAAKLVKAIGDGDFAEGEGEPFEELADEGEDEAEEGRHSAILFPVVKHPSVGEIGRSPRECNTGRLNVLSRQILACGRSIGQEFSCIDDTDVVRPASSAALPCWQAPASASIRRITAAKNDFMTISSGLRTPVQQMMLYIHKERGVCNQRNPVARPGRSNHNGGMAMDISSYNYWKADLRAAGWRWGVPKNGRLTDLVHFTYTAGNSNARALMLKAFQRLWNINQTNDRFKLEEDGGYGTNTRAALEASPADGFDQTCE